ncbi:MAG: GIY-YIG nuclease family protein [Patescibacteria group bacterium]
MYYVYIIQSEINQRFYYGFSDSEVQQRLLEHNSGKSSYTKKHRSWKLIWFASFSDRDQAGRFERYPKTPSGHAFSRKRLLN